MEKQIIVRELPVGTKFRIGQKTFQLQSANDSGAFVRDLKKEHVRLPNGKEFDRRGKSYCIAAGAVVDEVLQ